MRLRAAAIIPDNANAKVARSSMLGKKVEPQVSKLFIGLYFNPCVAVSTDQTTHSSE
jgi:hypothetical protein